jgi:asparagine synthetase B (glutamine-hydrolysing)
MCGIFCSVSRHEHVEPSSAVKSLLDARGPDASNTVHLRSEASQAFITCHSTVLSLRGSTTTTQPLSKAGSKSTLCWNGEAWGVRGERPAGNDTICIFDVLEQVTTLSPPGSTVIEAATAVARALSEVAGPYAFVFFDELHSRVYFGRDFLGRRSLLRSVDPNGNLLLSSITDGLLENDWIEVEADGVYCIELSRASGDQQMKRWGDFAVARVPYQHIDAGSDNIHSVGTSSRP